MAKKNFWLGGLLAMVLVFGMTVVGCDDDSTNDSGRDSRLVLESGYAWVDNYPVGERDGFIFKADGTVQNIDDYSGTTSGVWTVYSTGTWSTNGNIITFSAGGESDSSSYSVTGTTLTLDGHYVLTKTAVVIP